MAIPLTYIEGKYEILQKLSEGGMGAIYKVRHRLLDEIRVIKVMQPQHEGDEGLRARFEREARMAVRLRHPNVAQMYDFAVDNEGNAFIVMEYIEGITLQELLERVGPPPVGLTLELAQQSLQALGYLHKKGIIHRDIAPDNLMVSRDDEGRPLVKLIDLGIAKLVKGESGLTVAGTFLGKLRYSSPEHFRSGEGVAMDHRSDLYSFGVVLYELLTGVHPISGSSPGTVIAGHLLNPPTDFAESDPNGRVPNDLRDLVLCALAKKPEDRFSSAEDFCRALAHVQKRFPSGVEAFEMAMEMPSAPTQRIEIPRPGSTQERLDRHFKMGTTPAAPPEVPRVVPGGAAPEPPQQAGVPRTTTPAPPPVQAPPAAPPPEAVHRGEVQALLFGAEKLFKLNHLDEARMQLMAILRLDPGNSGAQRLLKQIEGVREPAGRVGTAAAALSQAADEVKGLVERGELGAARARLERAERECGPSDVLRRLHDRLAELEEAARQKRLDALLAEAAEGSQEGRFADALDRLGEAGRLAPGDPRVREALAEVKRGQRRVEEEQRRTQALAKVVKEVEKQLAKGDLARAGRVLASAMTDLGEHPELAALHDRLEEARRSERETRVLTLLQQARVASEASRHKEAVARLEEALGLAPTDQAVLEVLAEARAAVVRFEEERERARGIAAAAGKIRHLIAAGKLAEAEAELTDALGRWGDAADLRACQGDLQAAVEAQRRAMLASLLESARRLLGEERFSEALTKLQEAWKLAPASEEIGVLMTVAEEGLRRPTEDERRAQKIARAAATIETRLDIDDVDEAEHQLALAVRLLGPHEAFDRLAERIAGIRQEQRDTQIAILVDTARRLANTGKPELAVAKLREAAQLDPENAAVSALLTDMTRREAEASIEALLARGDLGGARRALDLAQRLHGEAGVLPSLRRRLEELSSPHE